METTLNGQSMNYSHYSGKKESVTPCHGILNDGGSGRIDEGEGHGDDGIL